MRILHAIHLGMCFGVRDAVALALEHAEAGPLTILGDLVHNTTVTTALRAKGIAVVHDPADVKTATVMVTAHGASERSLASTRARGLQVVEATCPLVRLAHQAIKTLVYEGYYPVIIGLPTHVEVRGLTEDFDEFDVVLDEDDVYRLHEHARIGIVAQTTQSIERVKYIVSLVERRFPNSDVRFVDTVCKPTKQRQTAARDLARQSDVVIVVGGATSNNTRELVSTCRQHCAWVHHVQTADDLRPEWFVAADTVGITAGTSTPDDVIDHVDRRIREFAARPVDDVVALAGAER